MKFYLILISLCFVALSIDAADPPVDFQQLYDRLLLEAINERIQQGEQFLERLVHQLKEYQTSKSAQLRDRILEDYNYITPLVQALDHHFQTELKRTDIDILQKFAYEKADAESKIILEALRSVKAEVDKVVANPATQVNVTVDWRQEYDVLLFEMVEERTSLGDAVLLRLQSELTEFKKTNSTTVKESIIDQVDIISPLLREARVNILKELNRTDLNNLERFLYEKANDQIQILLKHYTHVETVVKNATLVANYTVENGTNYRENIDTLLLELIDTNAERADRILLRLFRDYQQYLNTKDKAILNSIVNEIDFTTPLLQAIKVRTTEALTRTDLNDLEMFVFEKANDEINLLVKHFAALEKDAKAALTATFF